MIAGFFRTSPTPPRALTWGHVCQLGPPWHPASGDELTSAMTRLPDVLKYKLTHDSLKKETAACMLLLIFIDCKFFYPGHAEFKTSGEVLNPKKACMHKSSTFKTMSYAHCLQCPFICFHQGSPQQISNHVGFVLFFYGGCSSWCSPLICPRAGNWHSWQFSE